MTRLVGKWQDWTALALGYALIEATVWTAGGTQRVLFWISAVWFSCWAVVGALRGEDLGLRWPPLRMAAATVGLIAVLAAIMVAVASARGTLHGLFGFRTPLLHSGGYLLWSLVQQYIQQGFFFVRLERLFPRGWVAGFLTALLFGFAHLPNPVLAPITFAGGWILTELFRRYRSLYPLAFAHGTIGLAIAVSVPDALHHHMRVGAGYLRYPR